MVSLSEHQIVKGHRCVKPVTMVNTPALQTLQARPTLQRRHVRHGTRFSHCGRLWFLEMNRTISKAPSLYVCPSTTCAVKHAYELQRRGWNEQMWTCVPPKPRERQCGNRRSSSRFTHDRFPSTSLVQVHQSATRLGPNDEAEYQGHDLRARHGRYTDATGEEE